MMSNGFRMNGTLGQAVAGTSASANAHLSSGFWQTLGTGSSFLCGDADGSGTVSLTDAVFLVNYIFGDGPAPVPYAAADVDCSGTVNITDIVYLVNYIFAYGDPPCAACR